MTLFVAPITLIASALASCAPAVDGSGRRADATEHVPLAQVLPTADEMRSAVGNRLDATGWPIVGSIESLPNGIRDDAMVRPGGCLGAVMPLMRTVYEKGDVRRVALQDFARLGQREPVSSSHTGVVQFGSDAEAAQKFSDFVTQWQSCEGATVEIRMSPTSEAALELTPIEIKADGVILSATVLNGSTGQDTAFPTEHAVALAADCIVEADVAVTDPVKDHRVATTRAVNVVALMAAKINLRR